MMTTATSKFAPISGPTGCSRTGFVYLVFWLLLGIFPVDRRDWLLENFW